MALDLEGGFSFDTALMPRTNQAQAVRQPLHSNMHAAVYEFRIRPTDNRYIPVRAPCTRIAEATA